MQMILGVEKKHHIVLHAINIKEFISRYVGVQKRVKELTLILVLQV